MAGHKKSTEVLLIQEMALCRDCGPSLVLKINWVLRNSGCSGIDTHLWTQCLVCGMMLICTIEMFCVLVTPPKKNHTHMQNDC